MIFHQFCKLFDIFFKKNLIFLVNPSYTSSIKSHMTLVMNIVCVHIYSCFWQDFMVREVRYGIKNE